MARCEDYPCCGHEPGDCPDSSGRMKCVECGKRLKKDSTSSICPPCTCSMLRSNSDADYQDSYYDR